MEGIEMNGFACSVLNRKVPSDRVSINQREGLNVIFQIKNTFQSVWCIGC